MEAVEFIRTLQKMCTGRHCNECPLSENYRPKCGAKMYVKDIVNE